MSKTATIKRSLMAFAVMCSAQGVFADQDPIHIVAVEETWELTVGQPNQLRNAPQVTMSMLPAGNSETDYFQFTLNYKSAPEYSPGGMQVSHWQGEQLMAHRNGPANGQINVDNDTITWKQRMSISDGTVTFEIVAGNSQTWGSFGGAGYLRETATTQLSSLNDYSPLRSMDESAISFAGNRVAALRLTKIRWEFSNGTSYVADAPFDIDNDELDPWKP